MSKGRPVGKGLEMLGEFLTENGVKLAGAAAKGSDEVVKSVSQGANNVTRKNKKVIAKKADAAPEKKTRNFSVTSRKGEPSNPKFKDAPDETFNNRANAEMADYEALNGPTEQQLEIDTKNNAIYDAYINDYEDLNGPIINKTETDANEIFQGQDITEEARINDIVNKSIDKHETTGSIDPIPSTVPQKTVEKIIESRTPKKNTMYNKIHDKTADQFNIDMLEKKFTDPKKLDEHYKSLDIDPNLSREEKIAALKAKHESRAASPTIVDKFQYSKAPKAIAAGGATAWMVSKMSESKGQMSNSQLYGQQGGY